MAYFTETSLPRYDADNLAGTVRKLYHFCRELQETLQFVLQNLDGDNIEGYEEIFNRLTSSEGAVSELTQTAEEIRASVRDNSGKLAELTVTADSISSRVHDTEKGVSELRQTADGLLSRVGDNEGNISVLQQTAEGFERRVSDTEGSISSLTQTAKGLENRVSDAENHVSTLTQTATGLQSTVADLNGKYTSIQQTVDSIDIEGEVNLVLQDGCMEMKIVDSRGRACGAITSDGRGLYLGGEQGASLFGGTGPVTISSGDEIAIGNFSEEVKIYVNGSRYWTFASSGIYYCESDGTHLKSVSLV